MKGLAPGGRPTGNLALTVRGWGLGHRKKARRTKPTTKPTTITRRLRFRSITTSTRSASTSPDVCVSKAPSPRYVTYQHHQMFACPQQHHLDTQRINITRRLCFRSITTSTRSIATSTPSASTSPGVSVSKAPPPQHATHQHHQMLRFHSSITSTRGSITSTHGASLTSPDVCSVSSAASSHPLNVLSSLTCSTVATKETKDTIQYNGH